jgi:hypothetical protein
MDDVYVQYGKTYQRTAREGVLSNDATPAGCPAGSLNASQILLSGPQNGFLVLVSAAGTQQMKLMLAVGAAAAAAAAACIIYHLSSIRVSKVDYLALVSTASVIHRLLLLLELIKPILCAFQVGW